MMIDSVTFKRKLRSSGWRDEQLVAAVQDMGIGFSIGSLRNMYRGHIPSLDDLQEILEVIAKKIGCSVEDFYSSEAA